MAGTDQILTKARELGKLIAEHDAARKLADAVDRLKDDADAQRALNDFSRHLNALAEKQAAGKPIEVDDKRKLEQLQLAVAKNPLLRDLQVLQMDYLDLMRRVDDAIRDQGEPDGAELGAAATSAPVNPDPSGPR